MSFGRECCTKKRESTEQKEVCGSATRCPNQANKNVAVLLQTCLQCSLDDSTVHFRKECLKPQQASTASFHEYIVFLRQKATSEAEHSPAMNRTLSAYSASCLRPKRELHCQNSVICWPFSSSEFPSGPLLLQITGNKEFDFIPRQLMWFWSREYRQ